FFLMLAYGCEKADIQKSVVTDDKKIETRAANCDNCPTGDCCCHIIMTDGDGALLTFCGTTNPELSSTECMVHMQNCPDISGYYWISALNPLSNPDEFFCVPKNQSFMVGIGASSASFTLTCQYGQSLPQTLSFSLNSGQKLYYTADSDCVLSACHPAP
ncbi:MAG: hypothetical protein ABJC12_13610, partial [Saprospiraceae bacterium]